MKFYNKKQNSGEKLFFSIIYFCLVSFLISLEFSLFQNTRVLNLQKYTYILTLARRRLRPKTIFLI